MTQYFSCFTELLPNITVLDQKYVDSPIMGNYLHPRWIHLPVSEAKVSDDLTVEQAKDKKSS